MDQRLTHQIDVNVDQQGQFARRDFLRLLGAGGAAATLGWTDRISLASETIAKQGKRCILLWMQGGPSQFETFDPKPESGSAPSIATSVPGIHISENFPELAKQMDKIALIRSMTSREGSHPRAQFLMHHGYLPMGGVKFPSLGSNIADQLGNASCELPSFVRIAGNNPTAGGAGFLDVSLEPLAIGNPERPPQNARPATSVDRFKRRLSLLEDFETDFARVEGTDVVSARRRMTEAASEMILSPSMDAFDLSKEPEKVREDYGDSRFAKGCLLARRLLESGVTFVEVTQGGWDTHQNNHKKVSEISESIDQPMAQLLIDLEQRGMLDSTLIIWMGEFGRTPKVNANSGRDHFPRAFNAWLAGGGIAGGQVIGATNEKGSKVIERPVTPKDLYQTIFTTLGIDPEIENDSLIGRPIKLVDEGSPVSELIA